MINGTMTSSRFGIVCTNDSYLDISTTATVVAAADNVFAVLVLSVIFTTLQYFWFGIVLIELKTNPSNPKEQENTNKLFDNTNANSRCDVYQYSLRISSSEYVHNGTT